MNWLNNDNVGRSRDNLSQTHQQAGLRYHKGAPFGAFFSCMLITYYTLNYFMIIIQDPLQISARDLNHFSNWERLDSQ